MFEKTLTSECAAFSCWRCAAAVRASDSGSAFSPRALTSRAATPAAAPLIVAALLNREPRISSSAIEPFQALTFADRVIGEWHRIMSIT
jgi:hypothetical protein